MESGEPSGLLSLTHTYTHVQTQQGESLKEIHTYRGTHVYIPQKRWTHGYACAGRKQHRLTAAEHIWSCDPGTRKWVVFLREQGKRWGRGLFFMIRSCFLNTRIERNWPRSEAEFPILMRSVAHHPEQESGINLEIHSPRLCGGERRHNTMKNREAGVKRERIGGDGETRG